VCSFSLRSGFSGRGSSIEQSRNSFFLLGQAWLAAAPQIGEPRNPV